MTFLPFLPSESRRQERACHLDWPLLLTSSLAAADARCSDARLKNAVPSANARRAR
jgi:hypothetical protein